MSPRAPKLRPVADPDPDAAGTPGTAEAEALAADTAEAARPQKRKGPTGHMRLTADRILVRVPDDSERTSKGGLLIPATATLPTKRCVWSEVVLVGPETRNVRHGDRVLFIPQSGLEVEWDAETYLLLRERDIQAVASDRSDPSSGQYL